MTSYPTYFGLDREPCPVLAAGNDVFVAPQVATAMAGIKKAIKSDDAVIAVSGPAGVGKTTVARRALEAAAQYHVIVTIGRIQFGHDEVLELLLGGLGVRQLPKSTVHRFATFRRVLQQYAEQNTRVFILIEDATRIGLDALSELEAVTAADAGVSAGANLILLGGENLTEFLRQPALARLKQRIRSRIQIQPHSQDELLGYLKHCFRLAGRDFDEVFASDAARLLHQLADGIPRVANNLVHAALNAAADAGQDQVDALLIKRVASEEFGLTGDHRVADIQAGMAAAAADTAAPTTASAADPNEAALATEAANVQINESAAASQCETRIEPAIALDDGEVAITPADESHSMDSAIRALQSDTDSQCTAGETPDETPPAETFQMPASADATDEEPQRIAAELDAIIADADADHSGLAVVPSSEATAEPADTDVAADALDLIDPAAAADAEDDIPELIQDTLPDLQILAPQLLPEDADIEIGATTDVDIDVEADTEFATASEPEVLDTTAAAQADAAAVAEELPVLSAHPEDPTLRAADDAPPTELSMPSIEVPSIEVPSIEPPLETPAAASDDVPVLNLDAPLDAGLKIAAPEVNDSAPAEVPDWERDPTLAQLRPDFDALEAAMADDAAEVEERTPSIVEENLLEEESATPEPVDEPVAMPEITLDKEIQAKIEEATEALKNTQIDTLPELDEPSAASATNDQAPAANDAAVPAAEETADSADRADLELDKIANELAKARTIEDVDDDMLAETLFGEEFSMIAAQVAANAPNIANETVVAAGTLPGETVDTPALSLEDEPAPSDNSDNRATAPTANDTIDTSSSQRLQVLRDLNNQAPPPGAPPVPEATESIVMAGDGIESPGAGNKARGVDSIEDQINTSMTQTLKALNIDNMAAPTNDDDDDDETVEKTGFFGLFKRR